MFYSTTQVAQELGLSRRRISELVRVGELTATNIAGRWLVDASTVARFRIVDRAIGRPWDSNLAWEMITALSGQNDHVSARAFRRLLATSVESLIQHIHRLIAVEHYEAEDIDEADPHIFRTGESAIARIDNLLTGAGTEFHLYTDIQNIPQHFRTVRSVQGNLVVHSWRDGIKRVTEETPSMLVAIDAAGSADPRVRYAGIEFVTKELQKWQEKHSPSR